MCKFTHRILLIAALMFAFLLGACATSTASAEQTRPIKIWAQNENGKYETLCVVDDNTGVNYIVVSGEIYSESVGIAITPRLNADGTLYTSK